MAEHGREQRCRSCSRGGRQDHRRRQTVERVGSAMTLVARRLRRDQPGSARPSSTPARSGLRPTRARRSSSASRNWQAHQNVRGTTADVPRRSAAGCRWPPATSFTDDDVRNAAQVLRRSARRSPANLFDDQRPARPGHPRRHRHSSASSASSRPRARTCDRRGPGRRDPDRPVDDGPKFRVSRPIGPGRVRPRRPASPRPPRPRPTRSTRSATLYPASVTQTLYPDASRPMQQADTPMAVNVRFRQHRPDHVRRLRPGLDPAGRRPR